jgi:hypothetical protein
MPATQGNDDFGASAIEHIERVAADGPEARIIAFLYELLERTDLTLDELRALDLDPLHLTALLLLTGRKSPSSSRCWPWRSPPARRAGWPAQWPRSVRRADLRHARRRRRRIEL